MSTLRKSVSVGLADVHVRDDRNERLRSCHVPVPRRELRLVHQELRGAVRLHQAGAGRRQGDQEPVRRLLRQGERKRRGCSEMVAHRHSVHVLVGQQLYAIFTNRICTRTDAS